MKIHQDTDSCASLPLIYPIWCKEIQIMLQLPALMLAFLFASEQILEKVNCIMKKDSYFSSIF